MPSTSTKRRTRKRKWVKSVTTDSTHPPTGTFNDSAAEIARKMARKVVSPGGLGSGIRMVQDLDQSRREESQRTAPRGARASEADTSGGQRLLPRKDERAQPVVWPPSEFTRRQDAGEVAMTLERLRDASFVISDPCRSPRSEPLLWGFSTRRHRRERCVIESPDDCG